MAGISKIDPRYIVGFTDGEGSFDLSCYNDTSKTFKNWRFGFSLTNKNFLILQLIQSTLEVGELFPRNPDPNFPNWSKTWRYQVRDEKGLRKVSKFFDENLLLIKDEEYRIWKLGVFLKLSIRYQKRNSRIAEEIYQKIRKKLRECENRRIC